MATVKEVRELIKNANDDDVVDVVTQQVIVLRTKPIENVEVLSANAQSTEMGETEGAV